jgi:hypothetical protein
MLLTTVGHGEEAMDAHRVGTECAHQVKVALEDGGVRGAVVGRTKPQVVVIAPQGWRVEHRAEQVRHSVE